MGGEWGVGASLVMEKVSARWRGLLSGVLQEGYAAGNLLSAVAAYFLLDRTFLRDFDPNGWRLMFFIGGVPALLAVFIRFFVKESEVWQRTKADDWAHLGKSLLSHWKLFLYLTALMAMMNLSSHGTQDMFPTFMKTYRGLEIKVYSKIVIIMAVGAIFGGILFGMASDRFGRRKMMMLAFVGALAVVYPWATSSGVTAIIVSAFLMQFMVQGAWGIIPAHINELSPDRVRGFLPGFAYQCGNLIASSIAVLQATLAQDHPYPAVMGISAGCIFAVAIVVVGLGKEKRGKIFGVADQLPTSPACIRLNRDAGKHMPHVRQRHIKVPRLGRIPVGQARLALGVERVAVRVPQVHKVGVAVVPQDRVRVAGADARGHCPVLRCPRGRQPLLRDRFIKLVAELGEGRIQMRLECRRFNRRRGLRVRVSIRLCSAVVLPGLTRTEADACHRVPCHQPDRGGR